MVHKISSAFQASDRSIENGSARFLTTSTQFCPNHFKLNPGCFEKATQKNCYSLDAESTSHSHYPAEPFLEDLLQRLSIIPSTERFHSIISKCSHLPSYSPIPKQTRPRRSPLKAFNLPRSAQHLFSRRDYSPMRSRAALKNSQRPRPCVNDPLHISARQHSACMYTKHDEQRKSALIPILSPPPHRCGTSISWPSMTLLVFFSLYRLRLVY